MSDDEQLTDRADDGSAMASSASDEGVPAWFRKAALEEVDSLKEIRAISWEQHSHSFKWITASLLAVNGGACLAILNQSELQTEIRLASGAAFVVGIFLALLVAVLGQRSIQKSFLPLQRMIGYWMAVADDGERVEEMETQLGQELQGSVRLSRVGQVAGWLSAIAFLVGIVLAGLGIGAEDPLRGTALETNVGQVQQ